MVVGVLASSLLNDAWAGIVVVVVRDVVDEAEGGADRCDRCSDRSEASSFPGNARMGVIINVLVVAFIVPE